MLKVLLEALLLAVCAIPAIHRPVADSRALAALTRAFRAFSRRKSTACLSLGLLTLLVRAALLPLWPIPRPVIYDEFSYLLQADTFAHGRLANPPHALWQFFESIYILQQPTYASKYPPGQALMLAAGQVLLGNPWFGVWLSCGLLAAALCWALQGWLRPPWALLGALISLDLCIFSYWMNSYWGGAVAALGGAMLVGAWVRIVRGQTSCSWIFAAGAVVLLYTRPYEGFLLAAPAAIALLLRTRSASVWLPIIAVAAAGLSWQAFYDYRVTGHPLRMPYQEYFSQYESIPPLNILPVQPRKQYRHFDLEFLDSGWTAQTNQKARSWRLFPLRFDDLYRTLSIMFGNPFYLLILLAGAPVWLVSRRVRVLPILAGAMAAGALLELVWYVHYGAPFTAVFFILLMYSLRAVRARIPTGNPAGNFAVLALFMVLTGSAIAVEGIHVLQHRTPDQILPVNGRRPAIEANLLKNSPGRHVIFVRYTGTQTPHEEWIYNSADIDAAPVIWAQDMGSEDVRLTRYYPDRSFWLFEPDINPTRLESYPR